MRRERRPEPRARPVEPAGRFVYGVNPVLETLRARPERIEHLYLVDGQVASSHAAELLSRARDAGVRIHRVPRDRLASMAQGGVHQGVLAEVRELDYAELADLIEAARQSERPPLLIALDGIQDPQNLGAIIRSAHALGAHGVVIPKDRASGLTGAVAKASAGAIEHCPVARVVNLGRALEELKEAGFWIAAADPMASQKIWEVDLTGPLALVIGAEGGGVRKGVLDKCDHRIAVPMAGEIASLNASVSAGVLLYEVSRQRAVAKR